MRINQFIALATGLSRRAADTSIIEERVRINDQLATLGDQVGAEDEVSLDGQLISTRPLQTILLNKPVGYVTSRVKQGNDPTIYDLLPPELHHLKPVGRLDRDSSGLILLTNDGNFAHELQHPSAGKWKTYAVTLNRNLKPADHQALEQGVELEDGVSRLQITHSHGANVSVKLQEGRNRQVRRSFAALGYKVLKLHRPAFGDFELGELQPGEWQRIGDDSR